MTVILAPFPWELNVTQHYKILHIAEEVSEEDIRKEVVVRLGARIMEKAQLTKRKDHKGRAIWNMTPHLWPRNGGCRARLGRRPGPSGGHAWPTQETMAGPRQRMDGLQWWSLCGMPQEGTCHNRLPILQPTTPHWLLPEWRNTPKINRTSQKYIEVELEMSRLP